VRRNRVSDQLFAAQVENGREIQPALGGRETADVPDQLRPGHRSGQSAPDHVRDHHRGLLRCRRVAAPARGDPGDGALAHQPSGTSAAGHPARIGAPAIAASVSRRVLRCGSEPSEDGAGRDARRVSGLCVGRRPAPVSGGRRRLPCHRCSGGIRRGLPGHGLRRPAGVSRRRGAARHGRESGPVRGRRRRRPRRRSGSAPRLRFREHRCGGTGPRLLAARGWRPDGHRSPPAPGACKVRTLA